MYRIIWTLQILGLAQFVRVFNNENAFVSTWGIEQNMALFLSIIIFFLFGFIRARKYNNYALMYNILAHGSKEDPIERTIDSIRNILIMIALILFGVFIYQYSGNISETFSNVFSPIWAFLKTIFFSDTFDAILYLLILNGPMAYASEYFQNKVSKNFNSFWYGSYITLICIGLFLGGGFETIQSQPSFLSKIGFLIGYSIAGLVVSYFCAMLIMLLTKLHKFIDNE
jgi:hypothetical protein